MKKVLALFFIICLGLVLFTGCNRDNQDDPDPQVTDNGTDTDQQDTNNQTDTGQEDQTPDPDPATPLRTDMNMALGGEVGSLDPFNFIGEENIVA